MSGAYDLVSLSGEYAKHLLSIIINNYNKHNIKYYIDENILLDLYLYNLYSSFLKYKYPHYYSIVSKIICNITSSLSPYINILSFVLSHLENVLLYITTISSIFHCVHSEIVKLSEGLICYIKEVKSSFKCYITQLVLDVECVIEDDTNGEYLQNMEVFIQTCTDDFEESICSEIEKLKSICFYPQSLFSIRDNLNKIKPLLTSNKSELSKIKSSISIYNIENLMTYINLNCEMIEIIKSEISSLMIYVHQYWCYFNSICYYISSLNSTFCESVEKLQTSVDINIEELSCELKCDLTASNIDITCEIPDFSKVISQIDSLNCIIQCHEDDLDIYDCEIEQCLSCIDCDNGCLKLYSRKIDQILRNGYFNNVFFKCSFESNMKLLRKINSYIMCVKEETNSISTYHNISENKESLAQMNNLGINLLSRTEIDESIFVVTRLHMYYKIKSEMSKVVSMLDHCICIKVFEQYYINSVCRYHTALPHFEDTDTINWDKIQNDVHNKENDSCLCMIIRYRLIPEVYFIIRFNDYMYFDILATLSREFKRYTFTNYDQLFIFKFIYLVIQLIHKITLWMTYKYPDDVRKGYCFCNKNDKNFIYIKLILTVICSIIENIWSKDKERVRMSIESLSSLLSEYQSLHVYTNYYSPSSNDLSPVMVGMLAKNTIIYENESRKKINVVEGSMKSCIYLLRRIIVRTDFSKDKFRLIYGKYSRMLFYTKNSNLITEGRMRNMKILGMKISFQYLNSICNEQPCDQTCCKKNGVCKICPIAKILISCLNVSLKRIKVVLSNVSGDGLLNYLMGSMSITEDFITNLCVGFGVVYTIMLKNTQLGSSSYPIVNHKNIIESRNWGYDTRYEHQVSTNTGNRDG